MASNPRSLLLRLMPTSHRLLLEKLVKARLPAIKGRVLVVGAGLDPYREYLSAAESVVSTDISDEAGVLDMVADLHDLPFEASTFDAVVAIEVFEHLHSPAAAAREMLRVLKPGGTAVVSVPFLFRIHGDPMDFTRFTKSGLEVLFRDYAKINIAAFGGRLHVMSDIVTTGSRVLVPLRVVNHLLSVIGGRTGSPDCPSGYWVSVEKDLAS